MGFEFELGVALGLWSVVRVRVRIQEFLPRQSHFARTTGSYLVGYQCFLLGFGYGLGVGAIGLGIESE